MNSRPLLFAAGAVAIAGLGAMYLSGSFDGNRNKMKASNSQPTVNVIVPKLGQVAKLGEEDFNSNCAACHGKNAAGSGNGPPLIHRIYEPNHHADFSFKRAVDLGVRSHHWKFGNMPAQNQVKDYELVRIVAYVRALQKANGIF